MCRRGAYRESCTLLSQPLTGLPILEINDADEELAKRLVDGGLIPETSTEDALHIAIAACNGLDYLLSWNCTHIANAVTVPLVNAICRRNGFEPPLIYTPQELMEG